MVPMKSHEDIAKKFKPKYMSIWVTSTINRKTEINLMLGDSAILKQSTNFPIIKVCEVQELKQ